MLVKVLKIQVFLTKKSDKGIQVGRLIHITTEMFCYHLQCPFSSILWDIKPVMKVHENGALQMPWPHEES